MIVSSLRANYLVLLNPFTPISDFRTWELSLAILPMKDKITFLTWPNISCQTKRFTTRNLLIHSRLLERKDFPDNGDRTTVPHKDFELVKITNGSAFVTVNHTLELALPRMISIPEEVTNATGKIHSRETVISIFEVNKLPYPLIRKH